MSGKKSSLIAISDIPKLLILALCLLASDSGYAENLPLSSPITTIANKNGEADLANLLLWQSEDAFSLSNERTDEIRCLALNIYFEARSETIQGQYAVGHVVLNRVAHKGFPNTICNVVKQGGEKRRNHCQFSWWCDGRSDEPANKEAWQTSLNIANIIYHGQTTDPTYGALWYHADYVTPRWSKALTMVTKIGQHLFYLGRKQQTFALNL